MTDNKLIKLFNNLDSTEKKACHKLLKSPFFNQKEEVVRLWEWIMSQKNKKKKEVLKAQEAYAVVFPNEAFDPKKWRQVQSLLVIQIEKLLVQRKMQQNPIQSDLDLAAVYRQKGLTLPLTHVFRRAKERLDHSALDINHYRFQYQLEWEKYVATESTHRGKKNNLAQVNTSMNMYLIASKLRLACLMESHKMVSNADYDAPFLALILKYIEEHDILQTPTIGLYYYCYKSLNAGTESDFRAFRETLKREEKTIPTEERTTFLLLAINYCIKQLNSGDQRYIHEALELYRTGLDTKILLLDGHLSRFAYKNIVALALKLREFEWVAYFIDTYAPLLKDEHRETNRNYNLARLYFTKKEFDKAMPILAQIDPNDLLLKLDIRVLLLKMYFEMEEYKALDNLMTSFRILLTRKKKAIGYHHQHYLNMLRYFRKMIRLNPYDREAVANFKKEVAANSGVIERDWILEFVSRWKH